MGNDLKEELQKSLEEKLVDTLMKRGLKISFAESCTGGMCAARLVGVANASCVFDAGIVTYANEAKVRYLSVKESTIAKYGVVSEPVAGEMAAGVAKAQNAEVGVGVSGIAGPSGGSVEKPVGTVCFGFYVNGTVTVETKHFNNLSRNEVRAAATEYVYERLNELL